MIDTEINGALWRDSMLSLKPMKLKGPVAWNLPPSKSHMIRWLAITSQNERETIIRFNGEPGDDIKSMKKCMESFGVKVSQSDNEWKIRGVTLLKSDIRNNILDCGNSGTTANFVTAMVSLLDKEVTIDGDDSLRNRDFSEINNTLAANGASITSNKPPFKITGPIKFHRISVNTEISSQPLSALVMALHKSQKEIIIEYTGKSVSRNYSKLTFEIIEKCGIYLEKGDNTIILRNNNLKIPEIIEIPQEISLIPIAILMSELHDVEFTIDNLGKSGFLSDSIEMIRNKEENILDLRDCSDFITPAAAILAIRQGGKIVGAKHAKGKESNRIEKTAELLKVFGMNCEITQDGLIIEGKQKPKKPEKPVETHLDHRIAMTAVALATFTGGEILNPEISKITDPMFMRKILDLVGD